MLSALAAEHVHHPRNRGPIENATAYGVAGEPGEGAYVQIWLVVEEDLIRQAAFKTPGCPSSTAAASVLCQVVTGRTLEEAAGLTGDDLLVILGGLPEGKEDYAFRAVDALSNGLLSVSEVQR